MDYFDDCPACNAPMRVHEAPGDDGTVITEDCPACGHLDAYLVDMEASDAQDA